MRIIMIGGGRAAASLLQYFSASDKFQILLVEDVNPQAPGLELARKLGIKTSSNGCPDDLFRSADMVIEATGNGQVREELLGRLQPGQEIMTSSTAKMLREVIRTQKEKLESALEQISLEFRDLTMNLESAIKRIGTAHRNIEMVLRESKIIALNATIEAARAGAVGAAFGTVVQRMRDLTEQTESANADIASAADESKDTLVDLQAAEQRMRQALEDRVAAKAV